MTINKKCKNVHNSYHTLPQKLNKNQAKIFINQNVSAVVGKKVKIKHGLPF